MMSVLDDVDTRLRLMGCYVFGQIKDLPEGNVAAIAHLARFAEVQLADCDNPECDHPKLPPHFAEYTAIGTPVGVVISSIEQFADQAIVRQKATSDDQSLPSDSATS